MLANFGLQYWMTFFCRVWKLLNGAKVAPAVATLWREVPAPSRMISVASALPHMMSTLPSSRFSGMS